MIGENYTDSDVPCVDIRTWDQLKGNQVDHGTNSKFEGHRETPKAAVASRKGPIARVTVVPLARTSPVMCTYTRW